MDKNGIRYLKKIVFLTISIVYLVFIFLVADSSLGYNPIRLPKSVNSSVFSLIPQGWGFFTRDPREPLIDLYEISETNLNKLTLPNSSFEYLYGFSRGMRFRASRVGYLTEQISETAWESFENLDKIDFSRLDIKYVQNNFNKPIFCSDYILVKTERIPWAWAKHRHKIKMPVDVVWISVQCN